MPSPTASPPPPTSSARAPRAPPGKLRSALGYAGLRLTVGVLSLLPLSLALWLGRVGGWFVSVLRIRRKVVRENLAHVLGEARSSAELDAIATEAYAMCGMMFMELLRASSSTPRDLDLVTYDPLDLFDAIKADGEPVVIVQAHLGNFDLSAYAFAMKGFPLHTVMKGLRNQRVQDLLVSTRERHDITVHLKGKDTYSELLDVLRSGGWVGVLPDQRPRRGKGVEVEFLGQPARIHAGPAVLALETGARIVFGWGERQPDPRRHHVHVHAFPRYVPTGDRGADVQAIMQQIADAMSDAIRQAPSQYFWFHRLWGKEVATQDADAARLRA